MISLICCFKLFFSHCRGVRWKTVHNKRKKKTLASITWTISYYLAATILTWARCLCHTSSFCGLFFSFLSLLGSLTHFGSPLEQFDRLICNQLFYNLAARWRAVFCVFRVPCVLRALFMDQRNSIAATHQHNHHVKTDTYNLWYSFLLKCTLFYLLPFAICILHFRFQLKRSSGRFFSCVWRNGNNNNRTGNHYNRKEMQKCIRTTELKTECHRM